MTDQPKLPPVKGGLTAYLTVDGAVKAAEFYKKAFAAELAMMQPPDEKGRTMHVHLYINGSSLMLSDAYPDQGHPWKEPQGFNLTVNGADFPVSNVSALAVALGNRPCSPVRMFTPVRPGML